MSKADEARNEIHRLEEKKNVLEREIVQLDSEIEKYKSKEIDAMKEEVKAKEEEARNKK